MTDQTTRLFYLGLIALYLLCLSPLSTAKEFTFHIKADAAPPEPTRLTASVAFNDPSGNKMLDAEEQAHLQVLIDNLGPGRAHDVQIKLIALQGGEHVQFKSTTLAGDIEPQTQQMMNIPISATKALEEGLLKLEIDTLEGNGFDANPVHISLNKERFYPPNVQLVDLGIDDQNQNGQIEPLEVVQAVARVQNNGRGIAKNVVASLKMGQHVFAALESKQSFMTRLPVCRLRYLTELRCGANFRALLRAANRPAWNHYESSSLRAVWA